MAKKAEFNHPKIKKGRRWHSLSTPNVTYVVNSVTMEIVDSVREKDLYKVPMPLEEFERQLKNNIRFIKYENS